MNEKAIGMFDSGIGGLTVYRALKERMPSEKIVYLGDTARVPYGTKSAQTIRHFSAENTRFLLTKNVKLIVVACNTSASFALASLQRDFTIPIIGVIEPGVAAAASSARKKVGIIGTAGTIRSGSYERLLHAIRPDLTIDSRECPLFVPLVEEGWLDHRVTRLVAKEYLQPLRRDQVDCLVLGCTHYPVLGPVIAAVMGRGVRLIDSAHPTAERVLTILQERQWLRPAKAPAVRDEFYVTDFPERFRQVGEIFLNKPLERVVKVDITHT